MIANVAADVAVPAGVTTVTVPLENGTPGTGASISVAVTSVGVTAIVPNLTAVSPEKFVPKIWTESPAWPSSALRLVIEGSGLNEVAVDTSPFGVFTDSAPVVALFGTTTFTAFAVGVTDVATPAWPVKSTDVVDARPVPLIVTVTPAFAEAGVNVATFGRTWNVSVPFRSRRASSPTLRRRSRRRGRSP